jgi:hypothetical protein
MADSTGTAPDGTAQGTTSAGTTAQATGSAPSQATAEAAVGGSKEDAGFWKAEAKKAFEKRDRAIDEFMSSDEFKALQAQAAKAAKYETDRADAERKAAEEQGKFKELYEAQKLETAKATAEAEAVLTRHRSMLAKSALDSAYSAAGGLYPDAFRKLVADEMVAVKVADDGTVSGHVEIVRKYLESTPGMFKSAAKGALAKLEAMGVKTETGPRSFEARDNEHQQGKTRPASLAEMAGTPAPKSWRFQPAKPKQE